MRLRLQFALVILAAAHAGVAAAQTLDECIEQARRHAPTLQSADAGVSRAEHAIREARAALSPSLRLSANFVRNSEAQQTVFPVPGSPSPVLVKIGSASTLDARIIGEYTLYSGGRNGSLVRAAQAAKLRQNDERARAESDLVFRVSQAFYRAIAAQRLQAAAQEAVASARAHRATSAARVAAGAAPRLDSLRARVDLSQRGSALVRAVEAVRVARVELEAAIGVPLGSVGSIGSLVEPPAPSADVPDASAAFDRGLHDRPEMASLGDALRENELRHDAALAALRPTVSLSATAQYLGPNIDEDYWDPDEPGLRTHKLFAGIGLTMPIYDAGLARARAGEIAADRSALEAQRRDLELAIRVEIERAISDVRVGLATWQADSGRVTTAREALRIAEAGYKGGSASGTDVRDAESALADARADEAQSSMDYWTSRASLDHATGATARREK